MPYQVIDETPNGAKTESPVQGMREIIKELKGAPVGRMVTGVIGKVREEKEPEQETLDEVGKIEKEDIINLLTKVVTPNKISRRSTESEDRISFLRKLKLMTLKELKRFLPDGYKADPNVTVEDSVAAEIIYKYKDISP